MSLVGLFYGLSLSSTTHAYLVGLKSQENTAGDIQLIEQYNDKKIHIVSLIYDSRDTQQQANLAHAIDIMGKEKRLYHITMAPLGMSARQIADGAYDAQYRQFFQDIKKADIKVFFRTMHEMNGGWFSWSSDPSGFKDARVRIRSIAQEVGITSDQVRFVFSISQKDLPAQDTPPSMNAPITRCTQSRKVSKNDCYTWEDYYPGDDMVDVMGFTMFNRGKAKSNGDRKRPEELINEKDRNTLNRIRTKGKPIIIDEVATTAVRYKQSYDYQRSRDVYSTQKDLKNRRLAKLTQLLIKETDIIGAVYLNVDHTYGLTRDILGEVDRKAVGVCEYEGCPGDYKSFWTLLRGSEHVATKRSTRVARIVEAQPTQLPEFQGVVDSEKSR